VKLVYWQQQIKVMASSITSVSQSSEWKSAAFLSKDKRLTQRCERKLEEFWIFGLRSYHNDRQMILFHLAMEGELLGPLYYYLYKVILLKVTPFIKFFRKRLFKWILSMILNLKVV